MTERLARVRSRRPWARPAAKNTSSQPPARRSIIAGVDGGLDLLDKE
jgi:hypothetical protein